MSTSVACTPQRPSAIELWTLEAALVPGEGAAPKEELWLLIRNNGNVTRTICVQHVAQGTNEGFTMVPAGPSDGCHEAGGFDPVPAGGARVVRAPVPAGDWLTNESRKQLRVWFAVHAWVREQASWDDSGRGSADWTGTARDARALGDSLLGR